MLPLIALLWSCAQPEPAPTPVEDPAPAEVTAEPTPASKSGPDFRIEPRADIAELSQSLDADALNDAGHRYYEAGDLYAAVRLWQEALRTDGDHALAHYNYACAMARARELQGHGCGLVDAPRGAIVGHLEAATQLRADRRERMLVDPDLAGVRDLMAFQIVAGADPSDPVTLHRLLASTTFYDPPQGAYGSLTSLDLAEDGTWTIAALPATAALMGADPPPPRTGTWSLEGEVLDLGEYSYAVRPGQGALVYEDRVAWTESPSECDA